MIPPKGTQKLMDLAASTDKSVKWYEVTSRVSVSASMSVSASVFCVCECV